MSRVSGKFALLLCAPDARLLISDFDSGVKSFSVTELLDNVAAD